MMNVQEQYDPKAEGAYTIKVMEHVGYLMSVHTYSAEDGKMTLAMTAEVFGHLGCPAAVTVAVQPGDRLNR